MAETVTVGCTIAGGLRLRLFDRVVDGDTGREAWKPRGDGVLLLHRKESADDKGAT